MNDLWKWTRMMLEIRRLLNRNIREGKKGKTKSMIPTLNGCVLCVHAKNTYSSSQILFMMNSRTPNFKASNIGIKKHTHVFFFLHNFKRQNIAMLIVGCKLSLITLWYNYEDSKRFFFSHCCILVLIFKLHAFSSAGRSNNKKKYGENHRPFQPFDRFRLYSDFVRYSSTFCFTRVSYKYQVYCCCCCCFSSVNAVNEFDSQSKALIPWNTRCFALGICSK